MSAGSEQTEPATPAPATPPSEPAGQPAMPSMAAFGSNESCPNCGARMAPDQRYCLNCGHRRGDPRLPFMDAVVFMESMNAPGGAGGAPPPPPPAQSGGSNRWNANAALIAGVATLVLAIGVGFLIGRTGHNDNGSANNGGGVKIVQLGGTAAPSTEATGETAVTPEESSTGNTGGEANSGGGGGAKASSKPPSKKKASEVKEGSPEEKERAKEKTKEVLHTAGNVKLAEPEQELGGACEEGQAGCSNGKFEGNFFGE